MKTRAFVFVVCLVAPLAGWGQATAASGYAATSFASGFVNSGTNGIGPIGLAFDPSGNLFVGNYFTGFLYKFSPAGGVASAATQLNTNAHKEAIAGLAFTKDGRLYLARQLATEVGFCATGGDVVEVDPSNGAILRCPASTTIPGQRQLFFPIGDNYCLPMAPPTYYTNADRGRG